jgi:hypothetical protein
MQTVVWAGESEAMIGAVSQDQLDYAAYGLNDGGKYQSVNIGSL